MTIKIGQRWKTRAGFFASVEALNNGRTYAAATWPFLVRAWPRGTDSGSYTYTVTDDGTVYPGIERIQHDDDLVELMDDVQTPAINTGHAPLVWPSLSPDAGINETTEPSTGLGDVTSAEKGSGARYNAGKTPFELIPLHLVAASYIDLEGYDSPEQVAAIEALDALGQFQCSRGNYDASFVALFGVIEKLGLDGWAECAQVFDYGRRKYAEWNWAKGMKWSAVIGCAARHLKAIIDGEHIDIGTEEEPGSQLPHRGHAFCNVVMLLTYMDTFEEGDDRAAAGLLMSEHAVGEVDGPIVFFDRKRAEDTEGGAL